MNESFLEAGSQKNIVDLSSIKTWKEINSREAKIKVNSGQAKVFKESPFKYNQTINKKVALWVGDITLLRAHAIVHTTNENFSDRSPLSQKILNKGGPQLRQYLRDQLRGCRTGDAKISKGFDLPARYVIHTVGPKYNPKYHTAAETALYSCYSKVLQLVRENKIKSLALCVINSGN